MISKPLSAMNEYNWHIEHNCPQCAAPVEMDEADHLLFCSYCRTKLYLISGEHFRYHLPPPKPRPPELFFIPYWRLKGLSFFIGPNGITSRYMDTNRLAVDMTNLPASLGIRPQTLKLKFVTTRLEGQFLARQHEIKPTILPEETTQSAAKTVFIGEMTSLIYAPFYIEDNCLHDALLKRSISVMDEAGSNSLYSHPLATDWQIQFIPTLCPKCGWDMECERHALVMICRNCASLWHCPQAVFQNVPFCIVPFTSRLEEKIHYLPFWRMKPRFHELKLASYADLIRMGNLPKIVTPDLEEAPIYFWSPAFKINPAQFLRWAKQMTIAQPKDHSGKALTDQPLHPVTLSLSEAAESILVTLADLVVDKRIFFEQLSRLCVTLENFQLVYHPFLVRNNELTHAEMPLRLDKNALALGSQL
jgi:hypothetical protein